MLRRRPVCRAQQCGLGPPRCRASVQQASRSGRTNRTSCPERSSSANSARTAASPSPVAPPRRAPVRSSSYGRARSRGGTRRRLHTPTGVVPAISGGSKGSSALSSVSCSGASSPCRLGHARQGSRSRAESSALQRASRAGPVGRSALAPRVASAAISFCAPEAAARSPPTRASMAAERLEKVSMAACGCRRSRTVPGRPGADAGRARA